MTGPLHILQVLYFDRSIRTAPGKITCICDDSSTETGGPSKYCAALLSPSRIRINVRGLKLILKSKALGSTTADAQSLTLPDSVSALALRQAVSIHAQEQEHAHATAQSSTAHCLHYGKSSDPEHAPVSDRKTTLAPAHRRRSMVFMIC